MKMSEGPLFPKKTSEEWQEEAPPVVIERSDDPNFGKTTSTGRPSLPNVQGKQIGCGSTSMFALLLGIGMIGLLAARVLL
jgi:hypothetical protein